MNTNTLQLFEDAAKKNGQTYWYAHDLMDWLGYNSWQTFKTVIKKAMGTCSRIDTDPTEAFIRDEVQIEGKLLKTYRLTRFACFLVAMSADAAKPQVAKMQAVLAAIADGIIKQQIQSDGLERIETREELKLAEKSMSQAAVYNGLLPEHLGIFKDAGFRGMYNRSLRELNVYKGTPEGKTLYDFMGLEEMAGNLFRVTQTTARIRRQNVRGLDPMAQTAKQVGSEVREMMIKSSGHAPENLPLEEDVKRLRSQFKKVNREMEKLDKPKRKIKKEE